MSHGVWPVFLVAVLLASAVFPLSGCSSEDEDVSNKLDSRLIALIDAEKRGETESFVQSRGFDLVDGSVMVSIKCVPGQLKAAVKAAARLGTVEVVADRAETMKALIPIASLTALAKEESISFIREPIKGKTTTDG